MTKTASALLTPNEVRAIIKVCHRSVDRVLITLLYEGGFRVGEIGTMRWGDLKFDQFGIIVNVNFKTGIPRYVRIIMSKDYLEQWRHDYPGVAEGDSLVFLNRNGKPLTHVSVTKQLLRLAKRAGVTKHITPHIFRHSWITHVIQEGVSESVIKLMMWGTINSKMFQPYANLTGLESIRSCSRRMVSPPTTRKRWNRDWSPTVSPLPDDQFPGGALLCCLRAFIHRRGRRRGGEHPELHAENPQALKECVDRLVKQSMETAQ